MRGGEISMLNLAYPYDSKFYISKQCHEILILFLAELYLQRLKYEAEENAIEVQRVTAIIVDQVD